MAHLTHILDAQSVQCQLEKKTMLKKERTVFLFLYRFLMSLLLEDFFCVCAFRELNRNTQLMSVKHDMHSSVEVYLAVSTYRRRKRGESKSYVGPLSSFSFCLRCFGTKVLPKQLHNHIYASL